MPVYAVPMNRSDVHRIFLGHQTEVSRYQAEVYKTPRIRAISASGENPEKAQTALILALAQAFDLPTRSFHLVYVFTPEQHLEWFYAQAVELGKKLTEKLRAQTNSANKDLTKAVLRLLQKWLGNVRPVTPPAWTPMASNRWAAYGYTASDPVPGWVKNALG